MDGYLAFALHKNSLINITDFSFTWKIQCNLVLDYLLCIWTICSRMDQIWMIIILHWIMFCCAKLFIFTWTNEHRNCWVWLWPVPGLWIFFFSSLLLDCDLRGWELGFITSYHWPAWVRHLCCTHFLQEGRMNAFKLQNVGILCLTRGAWLLSSFNQAQLYN